MQQFRVLYRQFLFRLMDVELLSASAGGDASGLLGQFGALLIFGSLLFSWGALTVGQAVRHQGTLGAVWSAERFMITLSMLVVGVFALLGWDSTFPDRRDVMVLSPLPVRARTLFAAKIAAVASALGLILAAWNCMSGFAWPAVLAPAGAGVVETLRGIGAYWITMLASGTFLYCSVLGVQAAAAQLPRRWYLRASSVLQMSGMALFLGVLCFQPSFGTVQALSAPENQAALAWLPPYWFVGLLEVLKGGTQQSVMAPLARRAIVGLGMAIAAAAGGFLLCYLRTLRKIVEEPDVVSGARRRAWLRLPSFGKPATNALAQFAIRTLLRSRQHRVILAFYWGGGISVAAVYLGGAKDMQRLAWMDFVTRVNQPMMVAGAILLGAAWLGTRTVFTLPLDLRANWLFRIVPRAPATQILAAVRRAMFAFTVLPIAAGSAALWLWRWPWQVVAQHLLVLALSGSILVDAALYDFRKIPFTCSYLPGKSKVYLLFWFGVIPAVIAIHKAVGWELQAMENASVYWTLVAILAGIAGGARWLSGSTATRDAPEIQFEETAPDELVALGL